MRKSVPHTPSLRALSEAIHLGGAMKDGLPRFARNDAARLRLQFLLSAFVIVLVLISLPAHAAWQTPDGTPVDAATGAPAAPGDTNYFKITAEDVGAAIADQLKLQAVEQKAQVTLTAGSPPILYSADHPLKLVIHGLQIDPEAHRWQAQAYILANGKTEITKPVSGVYVTMVDVPVLTRQLGKNDVIDAKDITTKAFADKFVRKDTVTDPKMLIGQSPRAVISPDRPVRQGEISSPILIKKGDAVELTYTSPYMTLKATGTALADGAKGDMIRVKNDKSEKAVSGRVAAKGTVEVNSTPAM